jgi:hypothetical protein
MTPRNAKVWILYVALFASAFIYLVVGILAGQGMPSDGPPLDDNMVYLFIGLAAMATIASFTVPPLVAKRGGGGNAGPWLTGRILAWALSESVAIFGLVLYFIDQEKTLENLYVFVGWSVVLMVLHAPRHIPEA